MVNITLLFPERLTETCKRLHESHFYTAHDIAIHLAQKLYCLITYSLAHVPTVSKKKKKEKLNRTQQKSNTNRWI